LSRLKTFDTVEINPPTASVLFKGAGADPSTIAEAAESGAFFAFKKQVEVRPVPLSRRLAQPIQGASAFLTRSTGGLVDLAGPGLCSSPGDRGVSGPPGQPEVAALVHRLLVCLRGIHQVPGPTWPPKTTNNSQPWESWKGAPMVFLALYRHAI
jgi:hypothetical protein